MLGSSRSQGSTGNDACYSCTRIIPITAPEYCLHFVCRGNNLQLFRGSHAKNEQQLPARRSYGHALCQHAIINSSMSKSFLLWLQENDGLKYRQNVFTSDNGGSFHVTLAGLKNIVYPPGGEGTLLYMKARGCSSSCLGLEIEDSGLFMTKRH